MAVYLHLGGFTWISPPKHLLDMELVLIKEEKIRSM